MEKSPEGLNFTPEEQARVQKERTLSDAGLIKEGAEYVGGENGPRLEVTKEQYAEMHEKGHAILTQEEKKYYQEIENKIGKELWGVSAREIIQKHPELAEKVEVLPIDGIKEETLSIFRDKAIPEMGFLITRDEKGEMESLSLKIPDPRLPEGVFNKRLSSPCVNCGDTENNIKSSIVLECKKEIVAECARSGIKILVMAGPIVEGQFDDAGIKMMRFYTENNDFSARKKMEELLLSKTPAEQEKRGLPAFSF